MSNEGAMQLMHSADKGESFLPALPERNIYFLAERLSSQEKTTSTLLDQAFRIKDDFISNLRANQGHYQGETVARQLLENHVQIITNIVKQLSKNIQALEQHIISRDNVSAGTSFVVQSLDQKHYTGIGDLRGRVTRCDASILKLSGDVSTIRQELQKQEREIHGLRSALEVYIKDLEVKVTHLIGKMENSISDQGSKAKAIQGVQHQELHRLNFKLTSFLNDIQDQMQRQRQWTETQLQKSAQDQDRNTDQLLHSVKYRLDTAEKKMHEKLNYLTVVLENRGDVQTLETELGKMKHSEDKLNARIVKFEKQIWKELDTIKNDFQAGFKSIQESLGSLKQIQDTKVKLASKKIQNDIKQVRRKIIDLKDI
ncbi:protein FAM81B [Microcaecilia unicolor]|uniref:Protein FAM81B n=1 Tax=Microcaecilia unicolor TaxID=1415580 RepID=A0A6P7X6V3_9AMPH|nr:protein FAM81B [Microcaecilia unicolor]